MAELLRTPAQWASLLSLRITDYGGWQVDVLGVKPHGEPLPLAEFLARLEHSRYEDVKAGSSAVFNATAVCAKCGCKSVRTVYIREGTLYTCNGVDGDARSSRVDAEHFHRICTRCRYAWREEVLG